MNLLVLGIAAAVLLAGRVSADDPAGGGVAATVGDDPIAAVEVQRLMAQVTRGKKMNPEALPVLRAGVLEELVARRLVLAYAQRTGSAATETELAAARAQFKSSLALRRQTIAEWLKAQSLGEADLQRQLAWNVVWEKYAARYLTAERIEACFQSHHREWDATELAVSHILLRPSPGGGPGAAGELIKRAESLRVEISSGKVSFAEAARRHSDGPSRQEGGRLGWIGRHGPMDEAFSRAAFALEVGQVSPPVRTPFGVHLIRCDQVRPGTKKLSEVRKEVEDALSRELLEKLATLERRHTPVKYMGDWPHFKPGTHELAIP